MVKGKSHRSGYCAVIQYSQCVGHQGVVQSSRFKKKYLSLIVQISMCTKLVAPPILPVFVTLMKIVSKTKHRVDD